MSGLQGCLGRAVANTAQPGVIRFASERRALKVLLEVANGSHNVQWQSHYLLEMM